MFYFYETNAFYWAPFLTSRYFNIKKLLSKKKHYGDLLVFELRKEIILFIEKNTNFSYMRKCHIQT